MSRPVDNKKNQPLDLASFSETHQVNVSVVPVQSPADARVRAAKTLCYYRCANDVLAVAGYGLMCWLPVTAGPTMQNGQPTTIVGGLLGYLTGRPQK